MPYAKYLESDIERHYNGKTIVFFNLFGIADLIAPTLDLFPHTNG
jgi:hypothetical protein